MRRSTGSSLVQAMACRLFSAKPFPEQVLPYCQLNPWERISVKFKSEFYHFHSRKFIWKCRLPKWRPFCPGGDELTVHHSIPYIVLYILWTYHVTWFTSHQLLQNYIRHSYSDDIFQEMSDAILLLWWWNYEVHKAYFPKCMTCPRIIWWNLSRNVWYPMADLIMKLWST